MQSCRIVCLLIAVCLKAGSGAPQLLQDNGDRHVRSKNKLTCCRNHLLPLFFLLFCRRRNHASFPNNVAARTTRQNNQFVEEAAVLTAPIPTMMLIIRVLPITWYSTLHIPMQTQLTTTPQRPSTRRDQNGRQRPPWYPTPNANAHNGHPVCWLIVVCGGTGSGAPWRPWEDGNRQGRRGTLLLALASFYLAKAQHHNAQQSIDKAPLLLRAR